MSFEWFVARRYLTARRRQALISLISGVSIVVANLYRLRGWAYMRTADLEAAREALEESLRVARLEDENFGGMSAEFEAAQTLGALVRLRALTGEPTSELEAERDGILQRLGVLRLHEPPLAR